MMNEKIQQLEQQLAEISKLNLDKQPEAFAKLHAELEQQLNPGNQESSDQE
jgi:hypothetical protein